MLVSLFFSHKDVGIQALAETDKIDKRTSKKVSSSPYRRTFNTIGMSQMLVPNISQTSLRGLEQEKAEKRWAELL